jgi:hypothetical protein
MILAVVAVLLSCSGNGGGKDVAPLPDASDLAVPGDSLPEAGGDTIADAAPADVVETDASPFPLSPLDEPVQLRFGAAGRLLPIPLGAPTCGFMPGPGPATPYSENFSGSDKVFMHPTVRTFVLEGGTSRLLLVRLDLIATNTLFVERIAHDLTEKTGYDWTGKVLVSGSHTHSSAGRLSPGPIWEVMADTYFPQLFDRVLGAVVDSAVEAILAMKPAQMGYATVETDKLHEDRRCENPELRDDRLHVFSFEDLDGELMGLFLVHSLHGTIFGADDHYLTRDSIGGVEDKVKERFPNEVEVMMFQAGTGDISPASPDVAKPADPPAIPDGFTRVEALGIAAADAIQQALEEVEPTNSVAVSSLWHYAPLGRDIMGYEGDEFPFPGGGAYCGSTIESPCWTGEPTPIPDLDKKCMDIAFLAEGAGFPGETAPDRTLLGAAMIGDVLLVVFPGEPVTQVLLNIEDGVKQLFPDQKKVVVTGYSMDYIGYSTPEWDWYQGGYEASGAMWGPKQGDYLTDRSIEVATELLDPAQPIPFDDPGPYPLLVNDVGAWPVAPSVGTIKVVTQPVASPKANEIMVLEFNGGDPWLLLPRVILEKKGDDGNFAPVTRPDGSTVDSFGYEFMTTMLPTPDYKTSSSVKPRTFLWRIEMPVARLVPAAPFPLSGTYRFRALGSYRPEGSAEIETYDLTSSEFTL